MGRFSCCRAILLCVALTISACSTLEPDTRSPEITAVPFDTALWHQVAAVQPTDWYAPLNVGSEALQWRLRAIHSASDTIELQTFLWNNDRVGVEISTALRDAANRGVAIKLLLDDSFTVHESEFLHHLNRHQNIETRIYNPFRYRPDTAAIQEMFNLGEFSRIDQRMHNKVLVIDNTIAIVGGRNQGNEYFGYHAKANFRDMEVLMSGGIAQQISTSFDVYWNSGWTFPVESKAVSEGNTSQLLGATGEQADARQFLQRESSKDLLRAWRTMAKSGFVGEGHLWVDQPAGDDPSAKSTTELAQQMLLWIDQAEQELIAVSAYLIPSPELQQAVERARARGVSIKVLTNSLQSNNHTSAHAAYRHHISQLLDLGVEVYELRAFASGRELYMGAPVDSKSLGLHAKFMLIDDDLSFIGSVNFDARSLKRNTEIGLMIRSAELNQNLRELIAHDFKLSNAWRLEKRDGGNIVWVGDSVTRKEPPSASAWQRLEGWFFGLLPIESEI
jgi:putative cardiolipin synthase